MSILLFQLFVCSVWSLDFEVTATSTLQPSSKNTYEAELMFDNTWESWIEEI